MNADDTPASLDECFESRAVGIAQVAGVALVDDHHGDAVQFLGQRCVQRAVHDRTVLGQEFAPVGQELRIIVQARPMGLEAGTQVDLYTVFVLTRDARRHRGARPGLSAAESPRPQRKNSAAYAGKTLILP